MGKATITKEILQVRAVKEAEICKLLGWTPEEMFWFKVDACTAFIQHNYRNLSTYLLGEKKIWNWWLNQWAIRDMSFLNTYKFETSNKVLIDEYNYTHSVHAITASPRFKMLSVNLGMTIDRMVEKEERKVKHA